MAKFNLTKNGDELVVTLIPEDAIESIALKEMNGATCHFTTANGVNQNVIQEGLIIRKNGEKFISHSEVKELLEENEKLRAELEKSDIRPKVELTPLDDKPQEAGFRVMLNKILGN